MTWLKELHRSMGSIEEYYHCSSNREYFPITLLINICVVGAIHITIYVPVAAFTTINDVRIVMENQRQL